MFFVSQNIHIKQSPNVIKIYGELSWNICDFWEVESTRDDARGAHNLKGVPPYPGRAWHACGHPVGQLEVSFGRKESYIRIKIVLKF